MTKIKDFFKNKRNLIVTLIVLLALIALTVISIFIFKPHKNKVIPTVQSSEPTSSEIVPKKEIVVPPITVKKETSSSASSVNSSKEPEKKITLKVDGDTSSKPVESSKPQVKDDNKTTSKPAQPKPTKEKPKPPVSSEPAELPETHVSEPVTPPINPNGPQHGDTKESSIDGNTIYYHIGAEAYLTYPMWTIWGKYPQAKQITVDGGYKKFDGSFLEEGEKQWSPLKNQNIVWCKFRNCWITESSYNLNSHTGTDHG